MTRGRNFRSWLRSSRAAALLCALPLFGFAGGASAQKAPITADSYADPARWLCLPGRADVCAAQLDVRLLDAAGGLTSAPIPAGGEDRGVDCFYVYPTVDLSLIPGNPDRSTGDRSRIEGVAQMQLVPFRRACRIFAPLYRQATIGAYGLPESIRRSFIAVGTSDVIAAFDYYMAHENRGRKIVFIGHSQGSEVLIDMIKARMDGGKPAQQQLSIAFLGGVTTFLPFGQKTGGSFSTIPVCSRPLETGCFIAFASWEEGSNPQEDSRFPTPAGQERVCVNPAALDDRSLSDDARRTARRTFAETYLPPASYAPSDVRDDARTQTFTRLRATLSGACTSTAKGYRFFSIREEVVAGDQRYGVIKLKSNTTAAERWQNWLSELFASLINIGLHLVDMQMPMEDMVGAVERRSEAQRNGS